MMVVVTRRQGTNRGASAAADQRADQWVEPRDCPEHGTATGSDGAAAQCALLLI
jgi:hypothetical protein